MNAKDIAFQCFNVLLLFTCLAVITISLSNESFELSSFCLHSLWWSLFWNLHWAGNRGRKKEFFVRGVVI